MEPQDSQNSLTPINAPDLGYEWVQDVIYDAEAPPEAMKDISDLLEDGYKLGTPASETVDENIFYGLYQPHDE